MLAGVADPRPAPVCSCSCSFSPSADEAVLVHDVDGKHDVGAAAVFSGAQLHVQVRAGLHHHRRADQAIRLHRVLRGQPVQHGQRRSWRGAAAFVGSPAALRLRAPPRAPAAALTDVTPSRTAVGIPDVLDAPHGRGVRVASRAPARHGPHRPDGPLGPRRTENDSRAHTPRAAEPAKRVELATPGPMAGGLWGREISDRHSRTSSSQSVPSEPFSSDFETSSTLCFIFPFFGVTDLCRL